MNRSLLPAVLAAALALGACDKAGESPVQPSTYGNPVLQLPPPVIYFPATATLVTASPASGSVLREGQAVEAVVRFTLPPEAYPGTAWLQLQAGPRIGFTCGYMELVAWPGPGILVSLSCRYRANAILDLYRELGHDQPLTLIFLAYGPEDRERRYKLYLELPLTYTVQP